MVPVNAEIDPLDTDASPLMMPCGISVLVSDSDILFDRCITCIIVDSIMLDCHCSSVMCGVIVLLLLDLQCMYVDVLVLLCVSDILDTFNVPPRARAPLACGCASQFDHAPHDAGDLSNDAQFLQSIIISDTNRITHFNRILSVVLEVDLECGLLLLVPPDVGKHRSFLAIVLIDCCLILSGRFLSCDS